MSPGNDFRLQLLIFSRMCRSSQPLSPSSAPSIPSAIAVTHPSQFIHTHHPRRGSLTPLGLNIISPVPPQALRERENLNPTRNVGFHPNYSPEQSFLATAAASNAGALSFSGLQQTNRRNSAASTMSRLTLSRPPTAHSSHRKLKNVEAWPRAGGGVTRRRQQLF